MIVVADKTTIDFKVSSGGGLGAIGKLSKSYGDACKQEGTMDLVPVVALDGDSYMHKQFGEIFFPVFHVLGTLPLAQVRDDKLKPEAVLKKFGKAAEKAIDG